MSDDNRSGTCVTGKVRYADDEQAAIALDRVREARLARPDGRPAEWQFYACEHCDGWHLSSRWPDPGPDLEPRVDGEPWPDYAKRLERRIKEQRDHITQLHELRGYAANRYSRKKIDGLVAALGRMTARWEHERTNREALAGKLRALAQNADFSAEGGKASVSADDLRPWLPADGSADYFVGAA